MEDLQLSPVEFAFVGSWLELSKDVDASEWGQTIYCNPAQQNQKAWKIAIFFSLVQKKHEHSQGGMCITTCVMVRKIVPHFEFDDSNTVHLNKVGMGPCLPLCNIPYCGNL